jgi:hypothetical protein
MDRSEIPHDPRHLGDPSGASKMISKPMVCLAQNHAPILRQDWQYLQMDQIELPYELRHLGVPSVCLKQFLSVVTFHANRAPITDANNVSKRTEMRFHIAHVT